MKKSVKAGSYSILASAILIAIAVIVVDIAEILPAKLTTFDTTKTGMFTLSHQSVDLLKSLDGQVEINLIATPGGEDEYITKLLDCYKSASSKVKVKTVDPVMYPSFASQYTNEQVTSNSIVVLYNGNSKYISIDTRCHYCASSSSSLCGNSTAAAAETIIVTMIVFVPSATLLNKGR